MHTTSMKHYRIRIYTFFSLNNYKMVLNILSSNSCIICGDSISDPVCKRCYIKQVEIVLNDLNLPKMASEIILSKIKRRFPSESLNSAECILCRKDNVIICRYCFSRIIINILRELNFTEEMIENFGYNPSYEEHYLEHENISKIKTFS